MTESLRIESLELFYGSRKVCETLNCTFKKGRLNLVVGRAGSGKSTFLKTVAGFHSEFKGSILADDQQFKPEGNIALAFQNPENLFFNPTVGEEVCFALKQSNASGNIEETGRRWLEKWGLEPDRFWNSHPIELSGGEKRKVALAACTVLLPDVILLDEPLAGLDQGGQQKLAQAIEEIAREHVVLVVTHDPEVFFHLADGVLYLGQTSSEFYRVNDFVRKALLNSSFYPLPEWYVCELEKHAGSPQLPRLDAGCVLRFLNGKCSDADYLFTG